MHGEFQAQLKLRGNPDVKESRMKIGLFNEITMIKFPFQLKFRGNFLSIFSLFGWTTVHPG